MMTKEELLQLVNAGYTKEEIEQLTTSSESSVESNIPEEESKEVGTAESETIEENNTVDAGSNISVESFKKLNDAIDGFTKKLESFNIKNAEMDVENKGDESLADIMARVLLPDGKEVK